MRILITNDDGYDAPGLVAMHEAARGFGEVLVVAPTRERSACSHMITMHDSVRVEQRRHDPFGEIYTVSGTPADCVRLASAELMPERPQLVLSGINRGANAGVDTFYSGTVAAAREGAVLGIPSISISQSVRNGHAVDWSAATNAAEHMIRRLLDYPLPEPGFWSVNLPPRIPRDFERRIHVAPASIAPVPMEFERVDHEDGRTMEFRYGAYYWDRKTDQNADFAILLDGGIVASPIALSTRMQVERRAEFNHD